MTDLTFYDVVIESTSMIEPQGEYHTAICKTCSTQHKVEQSAFELPDLYKLVPSDDGYETEPANALDREENYDEILAYVAEMRAWQCCHEGEDPIDGFPEQPEASRIDYGEI